MIVTTTSGDILKLKEVGLMALSSSKKAPGFFLLLKLDIHFSTLVLP
jgi:hypothetical protein